MRRAGGEGECRESETSVMCKDFLRMGYSNFIVDPAVRLAYHPGEARQLYTSKVTPAVINSIQRGLRVQIYTTVLNAGNYWKFSDVHV